MHSSIFITAWFAMSLLVLASKVSAAGFSEPPIVIDGRVLQVSEGGARPLHSGSLTMTLVNSDDPDHRVTETVPLGRLGENGELAYRIEFAQRYLPEDFHLDDHLAVGSSEVIYHIESVEVDGNPASPLDSAQSLVSLGFSNRAALHRLDLGVSIPVEDTDGDGIPDWWEEENGLNPSDPADASSDEDDDLLKALEEFRLGTNPNSSNTNPIVQTIFLTAPRSGTAGLYLQVIDSDTAPENLDLKFNQFLPGLTMRSASGSIGVNQVFTYADVLAGSIWLELAPDFEGGELEFTVTDEQEPGTPFVGTVEVLAFSPANQLPLLWLDASTLAETYTGGDPITEWSDLTDKLHDGYQPSADQAPFLSTPATDGASFGDGRFLYLDDQSLELDEFTALIRFEVDEFGESDQTVISLGGLEIGVGGTKNGPNTESAYAHFGNRLVNGPHLATVDPGQITVTKNHRDLWLDFRAGHHYPSASSAESPALAFPSLGAERLVADATPSKHLLGKIQEVILFNEALEPGPFTRLQDYQRSRWDDLLVWDYRNDTGALQITGAPDRCNAISGGWGDDHLTGNNLDDTLRGGPGSDIQTGGPGADRFQIFSTHGDDTLLDFSEDEGDVLDLTGIFGGLDGTPETYLDFRIVIVRGDDNVPHVYSFLDLDHDGDGGDPDQTVAFANQSFSNDDLARLVGQGNILLGGPIHDTAVSLASASSTLVELEVPHTITLTRSGNTAGALDVPVSFTGSSDIDADYRITGASGSGSVRMVHFEAGSSNAEIELTPIFDTLTETETIDLMVMDSPLISSTPEDPLTLELVDGPGLIIATMRHASFDGPAAGEVTLTRTGDLSEDLTIQLSFGGSAINGDDYDSLPSTLTIPSDTITRTLEFNPTGSAPGDGSILLATVTVGGSPTDFGMTEIRSAEVFFLPASVDQAPSFADWRASYFPGDPRSNSDLADTNDDTDSSLNVFEYLRGTDPVQDDAASPITTIDVVGGYLRITTSTLPGISDVILILEQADTPGDWQSAASHFDLSLATRSDQLIDRVYQSTEPVGQLPRKKFYRIRTVVSD